MRKQAFGNHQVSVIGLGTAHFGGQCPESRAREFMDAYVAMGGNLIDTARVYGDFVTPRNGESEKVVGRWLTDRRCRKQIFLSTKGGHPPFADMRHSRLSREEIRGDLAESLQDLQTDYVDIFWLHRDDESRPVGGIMETLQSLIEDGSTRMTGVSNWRPERIEEANRYAVSHGLTPLTANQPQFSLARPVRFSDPTLAAMDAETWQMHRRTGMVCCCFSSQAGGFFTKLDELGWDNLPESLKNAYGCQENLRILDRLRALRAETGLSVGALALAYLTHQPFPVFALAGASRMEHVLALEEAGNAVITPQQRDGLFTFTAESRNGSDAGAQPVADSPAWVAALPAAREAVQLLVVAAFGTDRSDAVVSLHRKVENGQWKQVFSTPGRIGRNGLCPGADRTEGCGMTPAGVYRFTRAFGIAPDPGCAIPYLQADDDLYWSGDYACHYNEMVSIKDCPSLDTGVSEHIVDAGIPYQYCLNISFNEEGTPGRGSAIFLHCFGTEKPWTAGCVAVPETVMKTMMQNVREDCVVVIDTLENMNGTL